MDKKVVGFQIESVDGLHHIPDAFWSWEILSEKFADEWLSKNDKDDKWKKISVHEGDIEDPEFVEF